MPIAEKNRVSADPKERSEGLILEELQPVEYSDEEFRKRADSLPEVDYPEEVVRELNEIAEEALAKIASGELLPMTAAEFRAEVMRKRNAK